MTTPATSSAKISDYERLLKDGHVSMTSCLLPRPSRRLYCIQRNGKGEWRAVVFALPKMGEMSGPELMRSEWTATREPLDDFMDSLETGKGPRKPAKTAKRKARKRKPKKKPKRRRTGR